MRFRAIMQESINGKYKLMGIKNISVNSWDEAEKWCKTNSIGVSSYHITYLMDTETMINITHIGLYNKIMEE